MEAACGSEDSEHEREGSAVRCAARAAGVVMIVLREDISSVQGGHGDG